jgi:hypothetical protein
MLVGLSKGTEITLADIAAKDVDIEDINKTAERIAGVWHKSVEGIFETVRLLRAAEEKFGKDQASSIQFSEALAARGLGPSTVSKLRGIATNFPPIEKEKFKFLPASYNLLYEMSNNDKLQPKCKDIIRRLEKGEEYHEIKKDILVRLSKGRKVKRKVFDPIFTLQINWNKVDDAMMTKITNFINAMSKDEKVANIKVYPSWKQYVEEE